MTTGYILIVAILILGGVIANVGDRIGTRVGKKRLSLFNLRPKNTAVLVTILTGLGISGSTLAILFAADEGLRKGVFELEDIRKDLGTKRKELETQRSQLDQTRTEKSQVESQRDAAIQEQVQAQQRLDATNKSLEAANTKQKLTQEQLNRTVVALNRTAVLQQQTQGQLENTQNQLGEIGQQYKQAQGDLESVSQQKQELMAQRQQLLTQRQQLLNQRKDLQSGIKELEKKSEELYKEATKAIEDRDKAIDIRDREIKQRQKLLEQRDQRITQLDQQIERGDEEIKKREQTIADSKNRLKDLEKQQKDLGLQVASLEREVSRLGQSNYDLRVGTLALVRNQILAEQLLQVDKASLARQGIIQVLQIANWNASRELYDRGTKLPENTQVLQISKEKVEQLIKQVDDGKSYVVRVLSAGNYVKGEKQIEVVTSVVNNQLVFKLGEVVASTSANPKTVTQNELRQQVEWLISASQFRARNAGIVNGVQIGDGRIQTFINFIDRLGTQDQAIIDINQPIDIKAIATEDTYTVGPLKVNLVAYQNGKIIFST
jgi:uncharacterized protein (DUF3084 family)